MGLGGKGSNGINGSDKLGEQHKRKMGKHKKVLVWFIFLLNRKICPISDRWLIRIHLRKTNNNITNSTPKKSSHIVHFQKPLSTKFTVTLGFFKLLRMTWKQWRHYDLQGWCHDHHQLSRNNHSHYHHHHLSLTLSWPATSLLWSSDHHRSQPRSTLPGTIKTPFKTNIIGSAQRLASARR